MSSYRNNTENFYREIIQKVCNQVKEDFHNEGVGEDVIQDLSRRIPFVIRPGMEPGFMTSNNLMKYTGGVDINRGHFYPAGMSGIGIGNINMGMPGMPGMPGMSGMVNNSGMISANHFKSDPNKTTADNINVYLEKRNIPLHEVNKPKFTTVNTKSEGVININYIPEHIATTTINAQSSKNHTLSQNIISENDEASDSDSDLDEEQKIIPIKKEENEHLEDESLSSISKDSEYIESEATDFLLAQYDKVHRVRNKWKCTFKDAVLHINGKEYVFERVVGELERDW